MHSSMQPSSTTGLQVSLRCFWYEYTSATEYTWSHACVPPGQRARFPPWCSFPLVPDEHEGLAIHAANATNNGGVIQSSPIAMQLHELVSDVENDVQAGRPVGVASHLQALCRCKPAVRFLAQLQQVHKLNGQEWMYFQTGQPFRGVSAADTAMQPWLFQCCWNMDARVSLSI